VASVQFSRTVERLTPACAGLVRTRSLLSRLRLTPGGRRSLKAQQHAGGLDAASAPSARVGRGSTKTAARQSGSVDMLGPVCSVAARAHLRPEGLHEIERPLGPGHCYVLPRKEVIQPQLPLRLPCYDFTPVTSPTFDGSLPCGLGHRLRVLLTPVV
jgi:hypothetical protein